MLASGTLFRRTSDSNGSGARLPRARDFRLEHREDCAAAYEGFRWPRPERFNWALNWFDGIAGPWPAAQARFDGPADPGFRVALLDPVSGQPGEEGEICLDLAGPAGRPIGLMTGYGGDAERTAGATAGGYYRTGDIGSRDTDGYITYIGRDDDVLKTSGSGGTAFRRRSAACA